LCYDDVRKKAIELNSKLTNLENINISDVKSSRKFEVEIKSGPEVIFSDIVDADDLIDASDKAIGLVGVDNITSHDEVGIDVKEVK